MTQPQGGPLAGIRVIELAAIGPGPFAAMLLAELGAEVVRVERPAGVSVLGLPSGGLNRSRPNLAVDLKSPRGVDVVLRLVDGADILVEGMRPGVAERLGVGPDTCLTRNPRLVYGRMTGWGQHGPLAGAAGHDITFAAVSGALHLAGGPDRPRPPANVLADFGGGGLYLVIGVLAALHARARTGRGQVVDAAMVDGAASLITALYGLRGSGYWGDGRGTNALDGGMPFYDTYRCADGRFVAVGALEPRFYAALLAGLQLSFPEGQFDQDAWPRHREAIAAAFAGRTRDAWAEHFAGTDACVAPVLDLGEAPLHPHAVARRTFTEVGGTVQPRVAPRFSATPALDPAPERPTGADSVAVLSGCGFSAGEIDELIREGVVHQASEASTPRGLDEAGS